jgi:hypothetical protein
MFMTSDVPGELPFKLNGAINHPVPEVASCH